MSWGVANVSAAGVAGAAGVLLAGVGGASAGTWHMLGVRAATSHRALLSRHRPHPISAPQPPQSSPLPLLPPSPWLQCLVVGVTCACAHHLRVPTTDPNHPDVWIVGALWTLMSPPAPP